jgi:hypothetical protein
MRSAGQSNNFAGLFNKYGFSTNQLADISSDYTLIVWWASSMRNMAVALSALLVYTAQNPQGDQEDNTFKKLRSNLAHTMATVSKNTMNQFSEPWGMLATDLASGQRSQKSLQLICARLALALPNSSAPLAKAAVTS